MRTIYFLTFLALLVFVAVSAQEEEAVPNEQLKEKLQGEEEFASCKIGGDLACSLGCIAQGHGRGGYCNNQEICVCN
ncbi:defensin-B-like [Vespa crabro]|uniref:defensin-B-like n=1 Tax=Vespa crabro TaxID=7445 RepID=UPI001F02B7C0|nr:defensin-B-like [Vespa crabro]